jgi:competence protein ComEC
MESTKQCLAGSAFILLILIVGFIRLKRTDIRNFLRGMIVFLTLLSAGALSYSFCVRHTDLPDEDRVYQGYLIKPVTEKDNTFQADCLIGIMRSGDTLTRIREKIRVYIKADSAFIPPVVGDSVFFCARAVRIQNRGNPGEFDYRRYMMNEGIIYGTYTDLENFTSGGNSGRKPCYRPAARVQSMLSDLFVRYRIEGDELGVLSALVAGDRRYLDEETTTSYINSGAMHVLSVSGLHVGILYLFLNLLFGNRNQTKRFRIFRLVVILAVLWFYAFITGLCSSVLRASIMFSLFLAGKSFSRQAESFNLLAASALIILLINPLELFKVGCQYSYLAVAGILIFQPRMESLCTFRSQIPDRVWQLVTVSVSAQLATFPLSLFYFHQFPVYFLLTNLIVIPAVWLIMIFSLIFCLVSFIEVIAAPFARILNLMLHLNNEAVGFIGQLPWAAVSKIPFSSFQLALSYLVLSLCILFMSRRKKRKIPLLLSSALCLFLVVDLCCYQQRREDRELIIYNLRGQHAISYISGYKHLLVTRNISQDMKNNSLRYQQFFWMQRHLLKQLKQIRTEQYTGHTLSGNDFKLQIEEKRYSLHVLNYCILYDIRFTGMPLPAREELKQIVLIDRDSGIPCHELIRDPQIYTIIIMDDVPRFKKDAWKEYALKNSTQFYDMKEKGAFRIVF